jgi:metallo-beta-lactamase family protein
MQALSTRPADVVAGRINIGDRDHSTETTGVVISRVIRDTVARGGKVIVPAFALGRVEELLLLDRPART